MTDHVPAQHDSAKRDSYQFGESALAAERLRRLADVFEPSSREFLTSLPDSSARDVADLGCGPGHTTRLLAELFPAARVVGLDSSASFVGLARQTPSDRVHFEAADVTQPLPGGPYDVIYCRYLLTHLSEPSAAIASWSSHLRPGGVVAIEENDWIRTSQPAFAEYLKIVAAMLADAGQKLYVGAELQRSDDWPQLVKVSSQIAPVAVDDRAAAGMFVPNLATWRSRPFIQANYSTGELDRLREDLERLACSPAGRRSITFGQRRLVLRRCDT